MCYTLILMFWWLGAHFLYKILQIQNFIRPDPVKKPAKREKLKFMNTQHVTYHFSYFFMESSFLMSDLSNLDFKKIFWRIFQNIFWRFFIIIKSLWNTIELKDFSNVKQFGGFFKIFWEIFMLLIYTMTIFPNVHSIIYM